MKRTLLPLAVATLLAGCAIPPPLIAFPGQGKSFAEFQADDLACRSAAVQPMPTAAASVAPRSPNLAYAQCMVARGDKVGPPPAPPPPPVYAGAGVYSGFGDTFPWEYGF